MPISPASSRSRASTRRCSHAPHANPGWPPTDIRWDGRAAGCCAPGAAPLSLAVSCPVTGRRYTARLVSGESPLWPELEDDGDRGLGDLPELAEASVVGEVPDTCGGGPRAERRPGRVGHGRRDA